MNAQPGMVKTLAGRPAAQARRHAGHRAGDSAGACTGTSA